MLARTVVVAALLAAFALPASSSGDADLVTPIPPSAEGTVVASATDAWAILRGDATLHLHARRVEIERVEVRWQEIDTPMGIVALDPEGRRSFSVHDDVRISVDPASSFAAVVEATSARTSTAFASGVEPLPIRREDVRYVYGLGSHPFGYAFERDEEGLARSAASTVEVEGGFRLFVAHADVHMVDAEGEERWSLRTHRETTAAGTTEVHRVFLVLRVAYGTLETSFRDGDGLALLPAPTLRGDGRLLVQDARGTLRTSDGAHDVDRADVVLEGPYVVDVLPSEEGALPGIALRIREGHVVRGHFEAAWVDGRLLDGRDQGLAAAAALALLAFAFRDALVRFAGACYTRIAHADVLRHRERERLLEIVRERPGIHLRALQRASGHAWGAFHYHLGVLRRARLLRLERRGKYVHVVPIGRRLDPGRVAHARGAAALVYARVPIGAGVTQREVAEDAGISLQLVSHHLRRLVAEGFVAVRPGRPRRYVRRRG